MTSKRFLSLAVDCFPHRVFSFHTLSLAKGGSHDEQVKSINTLESCREERIAVHDTELSLARNRHVLSSAVNVGGLEFLPCLVSVLLAIA